MKKLTVIGLVLVMVMISLATTIIAADKTEVLDRVETTLEIPVAYDDWNIDNGLIPLASYLVISNENISSSGTFWDQPKGYDYYRVWVQNDTDERMTVTIRYSTGWFSSDTHSFVVPAGQGKAYTVKNANSGKHTVSFTTPDGYLEGTISVRVSDEELE